MLSLFIAFRYIKGRGRYLFSVNARLSFIGVFIGTTLLVIVLSIFNGFQKQMRKSIFQFDPHITLMKGGPDPSIRNYQSWKKQLRESLKGIDAYVEGMILSPAIMRKGRIMNHVFIRGQEFIEKKNGQLGFPDYFPEIVGPSDLKSIPDGNVALIGREMAINMGIQVGESIDLIVPRGQFQLKMGVRPSLKSFKVAGLFKTGYYEYDSKVVVLPLKASQRLFSISKSVQSLAIRLQNHDDLVPAYKKIERIWPYSIRTVEDEKRNIFAALKIEKTVMTIIIFLFIIAAMVGIVVATYNVVRSRRKDIGVLLSLGMSRNGILTVFTMNGFLMGTLGTILGILTGVYLALNLEKIINFIEMVINYTGAWYVRTLGEGFWINKQLIPKNVYYFDHLPVHVDAGFLHLLAALAIFLSGLASLLPAWKASRMEPIEIIRRSEE